LASGNCGLYCGAKVDFIDIDPLTYNLCPIALEKKLIKAKKLERLPKIIVAVHLSGQSCDMKLIHKLSKKYGFKIIEDASHAIGGRYLDEPIGNCKYCDITVFSFHPVKIITTGEGGMALTNNNRLAKRMSLLRSHGMTRDQKQMVNQEEGDWYYEQLELGFNYRMTDIQAALGISQLKKIDRKISRRHEIAERYNKLLSGLPLKLPHQSIDGYSAYHLYIIRLKNKQIHKQFFNSLRNRGIGVNLHYIPLYRQPYYKLSSSDYKNFPESESYYSEAITIPLYPTMTSHDQDLVVQAIKDLI
jgi:dTDP-4-amino-4,6-dideoxygalactose transaminase